MSNKEYYEDALFFLLMDEVCDEQGAELLEESEALEEIPNEQAVLKKGSETICRELRHIRRRRNAAMFKKVIPAAAVLVLAVGIGMYFSGPTVSDDYPEPVVTSVIESDPPALSPSGVSIQPPENYIETGRISKRTSEGIVEIITYTDPDSGLSFSVKIITPYSSYGGGTSDSPVVIAPSPSYSDNYYGSKESVTSPATTSPSPFIPGPGFTGPTVVTNPDGTISINPEQ